MSERHTVDFDRVSFNIISDAERGTITLQFDSPLWGHGGDQVKRLLRAIGRRYRAGLRSRIIQWLAGEGEPLLLLGRTGPHPESADVFCVELGVNPGARMESALNDLLEFLRRQPEYRRLFGQPLDRDQIVGEVPRFSSVDSSHVACDTLKRMFEHRRQRTDHRTAN